MSRFLACLQHSNIATFRRRSACFASLAFAVSARAQPAATPVTVDPASNRLRLIVPFTPGTGIDLSARTVGPKLAERLGRPVMMDNRVGASGNIGTEAVVRSPPNGSALLVSVNTLVMNRSLYPRLPFDPIRDLVPVTLISWRQLILVSHPKTTCKTAAEWLAAAKTAPGRMNYASLGVGTPHHLSMELLKNTADVFLTHIPYRSTAFAVPTATAQVLVACDGVNSA